MKIVEVSGDVKIKKDLEYLRKRKLNLSARLRCQEEQIIQSAHNLVSPASITNYVIKVFSRRFNFVDSVLAGFKMIRSIRRLIKKVKFN